MLNYQSVLVGLSQTINMFKFVSTFLILFFFNITFLVFAKGLGRGVSSGLLEITRSRLLPEIVVFSHSWTLTGFFQKKHHIPLAPLSPRNRIFRPEALKCDICGYHTHQSQLLLVTYFNKLYFIQILQPLIYESRFHLTNKNNPNRFILADIFLSFYHFHCMYSYITLLKKRMLTNFVTKLLILFTILDHGKF